VTSFGKLYSKYYDALYIDKDYRGECDFLERLFAKYSPAKVRSVIDVSCGTGGHALILGGRGYRVVALDYSSAMVRVAMNKAKRMGVKVDFRITDMRRFSLKERFDAAISMFDSINYLQSEEEVLRTFATVSSHLKEGGLFILQYWNRAAVLKLGLQQRHKVVEDGDSRIIRLSDPVLERGRSRCRINFHIIVLRGKKLVDEFQEHHIMRLFSLKTIESLLKRAGFESLGSFRPFEVGVWANDNDWSVVTVARKAGGQRKLADKEGDSID
jgi:SAM-dependent methyltransferase